MDNAAADRETKIAMIVAMSGATMEEASQALDENGANVEQTVAQLTGDKKEAVAIQDSDDGKGTSESAAENNEKSSQLVQLDSADDAGTEPFAARDAYNKLEYTPSTEEYTYLREGRGM